MKYLKTYNESINTVSVLNDIQDICLELEDNGFYVIMGDYPDDLGNFKIRIHKYGNMFRYDEVEDILLRLKDYLGDNWCKIAIYRGSHEPTYCDVDEDGMYYYSPDGKEREYISDDMLSIRWMRVFFYLKDKLKYNESKSNDEITIDDLKDICQELKDEYFTINIDRNHIRISHKQPFAYNQVKEVLFRLRDYLNVYWVNMSVIYYYIDRSASNNRFMGELEKCTLTENEITGKYYGHIEGGHISDNIISIKIDYSKSMGEFIKDYIKRKNLNEARHYDKFEFGVSYEDLEDICQELKDDGFYVDIDKSHIRINKRKFFKYSEVKDVLLRLKDYLGVCWAGSLMKISYNKYEMPMSREVSNCILYEDGIYCSIIDQYRRISEKKFISEDDFFITHFTILFNRYNSRYLSENIQQSDYKSFDDIKDICLELEDNGFNIKYCDKCELNDITLTIEKIDNFLIISIQKPKFQNFIFDEVKETLLHLRQYLGNNYVATLIKLKDSGSPIRKINLTEDLDFASNVIFKIIEIEFKKDGIIGLDKKLKPE